MVFFYSLVTILSLHKTLISSCIQNCQSCRYLNEWNKADLNFGWLVCLFLPPSLSKSSPTYPFTSVMEVFPPSQANPLENQRVNKPLSFRARKYRATSYKINCINFISEYPVRATPANFSHTEQEWTFSDCLMITCSILWYFILNQCVAILGVFLVTSESAGWVYTTCISYAEYQAFVHYCFPLLCTADIRALEKTAFSQEVISKTKLVDSHARTCSFYPLNRL